MGRTSINSNSNSNSKASRKVCPPNKFSFVSGCMSWDTALAMLALGALLIICVLVMQNRSIPIIEAKSNLQMNRNRNNRTINNSHNSNKDSQMDMIDIERIKDRFEPYDRTDSPNNNTGTDESKRIQYDINVRIRDDNPERPNNNMISQAQYEADKNIERIINPLLPPERSYQNTYGIPINIPSRGPNMSYQQVGILYKENIENTDKQPGNNNDSNILPLFGKPTFNGSKNWNYYTSSDKFQNFKLPISIDGRKCSDDLGCKELMNGDIISIPSYNGTFRIEIYNYDKPSYIPFIY